MPNSTKLPHPLRPFPPRFGGIGQIAAAPKLLMSLTGACLPSNLEKTLA
jgi:hypothetical protein